MLSVVLSSQPFPRSKPTLQFANAPARSSQSHGPIHGGQLVIKIAKVASREDDALYGTMSDTQPAVYALEVDWHPEPGWLGVNPGTKPVVDEDVFEVVSQTRLHKSTVTLTRNDLLESGP